MANSRAQLWEWAEYYCPFCYITSVRLHRVGARYADRVEVRTRAFPLELVNDEGAPRDILEQEWWVAAVQEPDAPFAPYPADNWPTTTLPAFDAAWAAQQQGSEVALDYDLRIRRAFFAEGRNIGDAKVLDELAAEAGLDLSRFRRDVSSPAARAAVLAESALARETYRVRGTPTLMRADGTRLRAPFGYPTMRDRKIAGIHAAPCAGAGCDDMIAQLFDEVLSKPDD